MHNRQQVDLSPEHLKEEYMQAPCVMPQGDLPSLMKMALVVA